MTKHWIFAWVAALALVTTGCATTNINSDEDDEKEQTVTMDQLPAAVKATLTKEAGSGKLEEIEKQTRHGRTVYEADVLMDGKKWEITVREDGQLLRKQLDEEKDDEDDKDDDEEDND